MQVDGIVGWFFVFFANKTCVIFVFSQGDMGLAGEPGEFGFKGDKVCCAVGRVSVTDRKVGGL